MPARKMHDKIDANTSPGNEKRQCFGTPFVWDQPQYQYCSRLRDTAPRIIEGLYRSPLLFIFARKSITVYIYFIARSLKIRLSSGFSVGPHSHDGLVRWFKSWPGLYICVNIFLFELRVFHVKLILRYFFGLFPFHWHPHLSRVASISWILLSLRHSAYTL